MAIDVARILLAPLDILKTDITDHALAILAKSRVRRVYLVGRRGPLQAAFTIAELREMIKLPGCRPVLNPADFAGFQNHLSEIPRQRKRLMELLMSTALEEQKQWSNATKEFHLMFLRSPVRFDPEPHSDHVGSVQLVRNRLEGPLGESQKAVSTGEEEKLECGLVFRSIGYKSHRLDATTPFDDKKAIVPNSQGRVDGYPGLYCSGWIKRGPVGVILTTMNDAFETAKIIVEDLKNGTLASSRNSFPGREAILASLAQKGITPVTFAHWLKIDAFEKSQGESRGKPREKMVDVNEMLRIAQDK